MRLSVRKTGIQGAAVKARRGRAAKRKACAMMAIPTLPLPLPMIPDDGSPLSEKDIRQTVAVLIKTWHTGATKEEWPQIAKAIGDQVLCNTRIVNGVLEKLAEGTPPENRREGGGRKNRIQPGSEKANVLMGALRSGFGSKNAALFVNELGVSPGKKPISKVVVARTAKKLFGMSVGKVQTTKTGSRDVTGGWARSRKAIVTQWRDDIDTKKMEVEGTLFVDEHSEYCMLGEGAHHGSSGRYV